MAIAAYDFLGSVKRNLTRIYQKDLVARTEIEVIFG